MNVDKIDENRFIRLDFVELEPMPASGGPEPPTAESKNEGTPGSLRNDDATIAFQWETTHLNLSKPSLRPTDSLLQRDQVPICLHGQVGQQPQHSCLDFSTMGHLFLFPGDLTSRSRWTIPVTSCTPHRRKCWQIAEQRKGVLQIAIQGS